jgi:predicted amidohydrolase YtcJ
MTSSPVGGMTLRDVEVAGTRVGVRVEGPAVVEVGRHVMPESHDIVIDGAGGALLPGLHDHHIHLLAFAAALRSVPVGPPRVYDSQQWETALRHADRAAGPGEWLRAVGYHESVAGELDRGRLDRVVPDRPLRVQHRSGAMWIVNSAAIAELGLDERTIDGAEVDAAGRATGRLFGLDEWLRDTLPPRPAPDLAAVGTLLTRYGVTGVTDCTPTEDPRHLDLLARAVAARELHVHVTATGGSGLTEATFPEGIARGPVKLMVADHALPALPQLTRAIERAHDSARPVAVHCVTRVALVLTIAALSDARAMPGDRIEHGAVVPVELGEQLHDLGVTVVTQPSFVYERGDRYLLDVDTADRAHLYPCRSLLDAGIGVAGGTDAPFGDADPWKAIQTAVTRRTRAGQELGREEAISPHRALEFFLTPAHAPGGAPRKIVAGAPADFCLLDAPLDDALSEPNSNRVRGTITRGTVVLVR